MKQRDAERSRRAILDAAEALFAEHGFEETTLGAVGAAAGLSRGAPAYFFGSKGDLYRAVLTRVFASRQEATAAAFEPVRAWAQDGADGTAALREALTGATEGYMRFLIERPAFVRLLAWEELNGGVRLRDTPRASTAMSDAFEALRSAGTGRGLRPFEVGDALLLYVSLTFAPLAHGSTLMAALGRDLTDAAERARHTRLVVDQVMALIAAD